MRILHVDPETDFSGGEEQVVLLMAGLKARGHSVVLACQPDSRLAQRCTEFVRVEIPMRSDIDFGAVGRLATELRDGDYDCVHLHTGRANWLGGMAAWRAKVPAVSTRRLDRIVKRNVKTALIYKRFVQHTAAIAPAVVERLKAGGVPANKISLIWDGVDPERLVPTRPASVVRAEFGASADDIVIVAVGRLVSLKGFDVLLDAFAMLPDRARLWIAGDGPERDALANKCGPRAQLIGHRNDVPDLLAACDIFVMPSRYEGLGVAALEAMAAGCPVVATQVGGLADSVVHERTGLLVPPDNASALAAALTRLIDDAEFRVRMGAGGPVRINEQFLARGMVDAYVALYEKVVMDFQR